VVVSGGQGVHRKRTAAGLGLSLVDAIVTAHGGTVTLDSHPSSTTFAIALPG
jgi:two-component system OmpR family sensor kinase